MFIRVVVLKLFGLLYRNVQLIIHLCILCPHWKMRILYFTCADTFKYRNINTNHLSYNLLRCKLLIGIKINHNIMYSVVPKIKKYYISLNTSATGITKKLICKLHRL